MTKRERALFNSLKRLRDAIWDYGGIDPETVDPRLNRAYMSANGLIGTIERERTQEREAFNGHQNPRTASDLSTHAGQK